MSGVAAFLFFDALEWDPGVIGVLAVAISVLVLCGSTWLLLATNSGARLGFLLAFTGLASWMFLMGLVWWVYAIGLIGAAPAWEEEEILIGDQVVTSELDEVRDLPSDEGSFTVPGDWELLPDGNADRAEAQAVADEALLLDPGVEAAYKDGALVGDEFSTDDYLPIRAFERGGEAWPAPFGYDGKPFGWFHDERQLVIQVALAEPAPEVDLNAAPPPRVVDLDQPLVTVVMVRDLGDVRYPPALVTVASGIALALGGWLLHRRDRFFWQRTDPARSGPVRGA